MATDNPSPSDTLLSYGSMTTGNRLSTPSAATYDPATNNHGVDYVIEYRFATIDQAKAEAQFIKLVQDLDAAGLECEVRNGDNCAVLIFVRFASPKRLNVEVYHSRVQDWLFGVRTAAPGKEMQKALEDEPITIAERLRLTYLSITKPKREGGAGITPKHGEWEYVESVFALHDLKFNKDWIRDWSSKKFLNIDDLTRIRDVFGEKIAFYFAFLQSYSMFLLFPAVFGFSCWLLLGQYSAIYAIFNCLWCVTFVEYWKMQQKDLAVQWGVKGVSQIQHPRPQFKHEGEVQDPITGETVKLYSPFKRLTKQLLTIPFALTAATVLGGLIATCFGIEIFISEVYSGPFKSYLTFLPTVILVTIMPQLSALMTGLASKLTDLENYETHDAHESAQISKIFVLNFITSYLPIFLTAFVYVPFAKTLVPYLDVFQTLVKPFAQNEKQMSASSASSGFHINSDRLKNQVIYFTVTAQIVNFALEVIVPYVKREGFRTAKKMKAKRAARIGGTYENHAANDAPNEAAFLKRVRDEAELEDYDVTGDFREMVVQFGYLSLFSVVWPLTSVSFLVNNWIELRGDALKIVYECKRPVPWRADSIGPWIDSLGFLTWAGSLTSAALVYLFSGQGLGPDGSPRNIELWGLLLTIFFSEHIYLVVQTVVQRILGRLETPGVQKEKAERYAVRKQYLREALGDEEAERAISGSIETGDRIYGDEKSGETAALRPTDRFWSGSQGKSGIIDAGRQLIAKAAPNLESRKSR